MPDRPQVVALVTDAIGPFHHGGKEQYYSELVKRLAAHAEVHVYTMNWWQGAKVWRDGDVTYHAIAPFRPLYSGRRRSIRQAAWFALHCFKLVLARFDVIAADHMPYMQLFPLRIVATLAASGWSSPGTSAGDPRTGAAIWDRADSVGWLIESLAMRLPDAIISTSPLTADRLAEFVSRKVPVVTATPGIDLEAFGAIQAALPTRPTSWPSGDSSAQAHRPAPRRPALLRDAGRPVTARIVGRGPSSRLPQGQAAGHRNIRLRRLPSGRQSDQRRCWELKGLARGIPIRAGGFWDRRPGGARLRRPVITTSAPANYAQRLVDVERGGIVCDPTPHALADAMSRSWTAAIHGAVRRGMAAAVRLGRDHAERGHRARLTGPSPVRGSRDDEHRCQGVRT